MEGNILRARTAIGSLLAELRREGVRIDGNEDKQVDELFTTLVGESPKIFAERERGIGVEENDKAALHSISTVVDGVRIYLEDRNSGRINIAKPNVVGASA